MSLRFPVVKVEDHDGGDHTAGHHEHDAVKIGSWQTEQSYSAELENVRKLLQSYF